MKKAYVLFDKRSCVTAKELKNKLNELGGFEWRMLRDKNYKYKPEVVLRWGNSYKQAPDGTIELNSIDNTKNATDKGRMAAMLVQAGVPFPPVKFFGENAALSSCSDDEYRNAVRNNNAFHRNMYDHVALRSFIEGDKYATIGIDVADEFRVHVFNGSIVGIYSKDPMEEGVRIRKDENCNFRRIDRASDANKARIRGVSKVAKDAVAALGLLFGGCDIIKAQNGNVYAIEVNSAPSLNEPNVGRWSELIISYVNSQINS